MKQCTQCVRSTRAFWGVQSFIFFIFFYTCIFFSDRVQKDGATDVLSKKKVKEYKLIV